MMQIINKSHDEITSNRRVDLAAFFKIEANLKTIYFSAAAADKFGIIPGVMVNFINDDNDWYFYCDSNHDGFLVKEKGTRASVIFDSSLISLFLKRTQTTPGTKFPITLTKNDVGGCPIFKIELNKPFED